MDIQKLKFPIGEFLKPDEITESHIADWVQTIADFPVEIERLVNDLNPQELSLIYRPGGWNIRQVVHHCADSHMNAFIRFKLALTENSPVIKPYSEADWAEMADVLHQPISDSLSIIKGVHARWVTVIKSISKSDYSKNYVHVEYQRSYVLDEVVGLYAWHCNHHAAHIEQAQRFKGQFQ